MNFVESVNIWQRYKQERDCLVHFLRLLAVCWPGAQSAWDNHALTSWQRHCFEPRRRVDALRYTLGLRVNNIITNKSVFSCLRTLTTWHCPHSPAVLLGAVQQSIEISCRSGRTGKVCCYAWPTLGQTDRRTDGLGYCFTAPAIRYDTIRDASLTCARKPTWVSLIYRTEPTSKKCKNRKKVESKRRNMLRTNSKQSGESM